MSRKLTEIAAVALVAGLCTAANELGPTLTAEQQLEGADQDALARAGLAGEHVEARPELQLERIDDRKILNLQAIQHGDALRIALARILGK